MEWAKVKSREKSKIRKGFDANGWVICKSCFDLRNQNNLLKEEIVRLRSALNNVTKTPRKEADTTHSPSSRIDHKSNSKEESKAKRGGAKKGHKGFGRSSATEELADAVINLPMLETCTDCQCNLNQSFGSQSDAGAKTRSSIMTLLHTVKKWLKEKSIEVWLTEALNKIAQNPNLDIVTLIPSN